MAQRAKIHHYVPKVLQRQFVCEGERIWYSTRINGAWGAPELRNIASTFQQKDLYTIMTDEGYSDLVERTYYGGIDNYLGEIIPEVLWAFGEGKAPLFRGEALEEIRNCAIAMIRRTPDFSKGIYESDEARGRIYAERAIELHKQAGGQEERIAWLQSELANPARLRAHGRDIRVRANLRPVEEAEKLFSEFDVRWAVCEQRASLVLPSVISYRFGNGGSTSLANPRVEVWIPINPKVSMALVRDQSRRIPAVSVLSQAKVREINEHALQVSSSIASHSQSLLESLTGRRAKKVGVRPGGSPS